MVLHAGWEEVTSTGVVGVVVAVVMPVAMCGDGGYAHLVGEITEQARQSLLALLRLPEVAVDALQAVAMLPSQLDALIELMESTHQSVVRTAAGIDAAAAAMTSAVSSLRTVAGVLDTSLPALAGGASTLADLTINLAEAARTLATDLPRVTTVLDGVSPELSKLVAGLDGRLDHLDTVVTQLGAVVTGAVGAIPGMRRTLRAPGSPPAADRCQRPHCMRPTARAQCQGE